MKSDESPWNCRLRMVQCVAVCCSVLQCVAVCCSVLQCGVGDAQVCIDVFTVYMIFHVCVCIHLSLNRVRFIYTYIYIYYWRKYDEIPWNCMLRLVLAMHRYIYIYMYIRIYVIRYTRTYTLLTKVRCIG